MQQRLLTASVTCRACGRRLRVFPHGVAAVLDRAPFQAPRGPDDDHLVAAAPDGTFACPCGALGAAADGYVTPPA